MTSSGDPFENLTSEPPDRSQAELARPRKGARLDVVVDGRTAETGDGDYRAETFDGVGRHAVRHTAPAKGDIRSRVARGLQRCPQAGSPGRRRSLCDRGLSENEQVKSELAPPSVVCRFLCNPRIPTNYPVDSSNYPIWRRGPSKPGHPKLILPFVRHQG